MAKSTQTTVSNLRSKVGAALVTGAAGGLVTLVDPAKFSVTARWSLILGTGAAGGFAAWCGAGLGTGGTTGVRPRLFVALGLGGLLAAGTRAGFALDGAIHQFLLRRGVDNPRMVMAISAAVLTTAAALAESITDDDGDEPGTANAAA